MNANKLLETDNEFVEDEAVELNHVEINRDINVMMNEIMIRGHQLIKDHGKHSILILDREFGSHLKVLKDIATLQLRITTIENYLAKNSDSYNNRVLISKLDACRSMMILVTSPNIPYIRRKTYIQSYLFHVVKLSETLDDSGDVSSEYISLLGSELHTMCVEEGILPTRYGIDDRSPWARFRDLLGC